MDRPRLSRSAAWVLWTVVLVLVTIALVAVRGRLDQAETILIYLLVVLGGRASGGRALGFFLSAASFLLVDYYLQPPYDMITIDKPLDWFVLLAFLTTATVAAQLLGQARAQAAAAQRRAAEIDRLAALGAETLAEGRAEHALGAILRVIGDTLGLAQCAIHAVDGGQAQAAALAATPPVSPVPPRPDEGAPARPDHLVAWVAATGQPAAERADGSQVRGPEALASAARAVRVGGIAPARVLLLPLVVHDRTVGVLRLAAGGQLALDADRSRFLHAI